MTPTLDLSYRAGDLPPGSVARVDIAASTEYVIGDTGCCMRWEQPIPGSEDWQVVFVGRLPRPDERMTPRECAEVDEVAFRSWEKAVVRK